MSRDLATLDFSEALHQPLEDLWKDEEFCDVTLVVSRPSDDGVQEVQRTMKCHKAILAACSPVLREMIVQAGKDGHSGWFSVVREDWESFATLVELFYKKKLELTGDNVWGIKKGNDFFSSIF